MFFGSFSKVVMATNIFDGLFMIYGIYKYNIYVASKSYRRSFWEWWEKVSKQGLFLVFSFLLFTFLLLYHIDTIHIIYKYSFDRLARSFVFVKVYDQNDLKNILGLIWKNSTENPFSSHILKLYSIRSFDRP